MKYFCLFLLITFSVFAISGVYAESVHTDLSDNLLRLHIIANSNSRHDQDIKLAVRDAILKNTKENSDLNNLDNIVSSTLRNMGVDYSFKVRISKTHVPEKQYKNIRLPEGTYSCINIVLGNGNGENWWCVAYPPLCFTESVFGELSESGKLLLENKLSKESFRAIIYDGKVNIRFKLIDEFIKLKKRLW